MFSIVICPQTYEVNVISIGRTAWAPIYYMKRNGKPVKKWTKNGWVPEHGAGVK